MGTDPRAVPRFTEDLRLRQTGGPAVYGHTTGKPVRYLTVANDRAGVIGYLWANDEDGAAGWEPRPAAGGDAFNGARPWLARLRDAKARELPPTAALREIAEEPATEEPAAGEPPAGGAAGTVVPGPLAEAPSLAALRDLAASG
ncbi:hypothetical protein [Streptomyces albus]|uniref:hypothetical protein n=1 Tax=Streptomyces albus TaxID=1888 RepID=UPI0004CA456E|nr:hypothetical protein [Streptomyces albus]